MYKLDGLCGRLLGSQNNFHWQLGGQINHQPCSRKQLESLMHRVDSDVSSSKQSCPVLCIQFSLHCFCFITSKRVTSSRIPPPRYRDCCRQHSSFRRNIAVVANRCRVVNWPTSSGPNPKTNLKPKSCPKKTKVKFGLKNFSNVAKLF